MKNCSNRYGKETIREPTPRAKGRRAREIDDLVVDRRQRLSVGGKRRRLREKV